MQQSKVIVYNICFNWVYKITSHHMVKTDAGLNGLYIREITLYTTLLLHK